MGLIINGLFTSADYQVTDPVAGGHCKNDASGNFQFGQSGSAWTFLETKITAGATTITFAGLDGDTDRAYRIIWDAEVQPAHQTIDHRIYLKPNGASGGAETMAVEMSSTATKIHDTTGLLMFGFEPGTSVPSWDLFTPFSHYGTMEFFAGRPQTPGEDIMGRDMVSLSGMGIPLVVINQIFPIPDIEFGQDRGYRCAGQYFGGSGSNITSLTLVSVNTGGLGTGTFSLYKIKS